METSHTIDVMTLDPTHRRAIEEVIGVQLQANQRLVIGVTESVPQEPEQSPPRSPVLEEWTKVYEGLSESQIEQIDRIANTRANLTRYLP